MMPLTVVYQDEHIAVIDKPAGLAVHPGPGHSGHTLVNALLAICPDIQGVGGEIRPGIVHRLDKDTSGLMVVAKTHQAHLDVSGQIKVRQVDKGYIALAVGKVEPAVGVIDEPIGRDQHNRKRMAVVPDGREARTRYRVLEYIMPSGGVPMPSGGVPMPSGGVPMPSGGVPMPSGGVPMPSGGVPMPSGRSPDAIRRSPDAIRRSPNAIPAESECHPAGLGSATACWKWSWKQGGPTRSGCTSLFSGIP